MLNPSEYMIKNQSFSIDEISTIVSGAIEGGWIPKGIAGVAESGGRTPTGPAQLRISFEIVDVEDLANCLEGISNFMRSNCSHADLEVLSQFLNCWDLERLKRS
jgi:hypothetical protein